MVGWLDVLTVLRSRKNMQYADRYSRTRQIIVGRSSLADALALVD